MAITETSDSTVEITGSLEDNREALERAALQILYQTAKHGSTEEVRLKAALELAEYVRPVITGNRFGVKAPPVARKPASEGGGILVDKWLLAADKATEGKKGEEAHGEGVAISDSE